MPGKQRPGVSESAASDRARAGGTSQGWTTGRRRLDRTVAAIRGYLGGFGSVPHRGTRRDDLMPGLRIVPFRRRTAVAFTVDDGARTVRILRVFYGGQDYEAVLRTPSD